MSKSIAEIARHPTRFGVIVALALLALVVGLMNAAATPPSNFIEIDGNVRDTLSSPNPPFDWANSGAASPNVACSSLTGFTAVSGFTAQHVSGDGGLFDCGQFKNSTTTPIAPVPTAAGTVGTNNIAAATFFVDPESTDVGNCSPSANGSTTPSPPGSTTCTSPQVLCSGSGDPTVYTGAGGEKNGDPLNGKGVETYSYSGVPGKDELTNVYAVDRKPTSGTDPNEVFFGGERVINNGESHIDFEFLQSAVTLTNTSPCSSSNEGSFNGHRAQGDFVASIEYTKGGTLGGFELNQWHCLADTHSADSGSGWVSSGTQAAQGTVCDDSTAHYQLMACHAEAGATACPPIDLSALPGGGAGFVTAVTAVTNPDPDANGPLGPVPCGGWACRTGTGALSTGSTISDGTCTVSPAPTTVSTCIDSNDMMEGGVNLASIGFTGCISTFVPHTRTAQSFTSTLKDFALVPFNTCPTAAITTSVSPSAIALGGSATDTATVTLSSVGIVSGTVDFNVYGPFSSAPTLTSCTSATLVTPFSPNTKTIGPGAPPQSVTSDPFTPTSAGFYGWIATYHPASVNNGTTVSTSCGDTGETLLVVSPAISTSVSPSTIALGGSATDTATVTLSPSSATVSGTVTFNVYGPFSSSPTSTSCTASSLVTPFSPDTKSIGPGVTPQSATSDSFTPTLPGYYAWIATYNPASAANGSTVSTSCGDTGETLLVVSAAITTSVTPGTITLGGSATDTATVTLTPSGQTVSGTVTFNVYGPFSSSPTSTSCTASSLVTPFSPDTKSIGPGVTPQSVTSDAFTPTATGFYGWIATYTPAGAANGTTVSTTCGDAGEILIVTTIPKITAFGFTNTPTSSDPTLGSGTVTYSVTIHNYGALAVMLSGSLAVSGTASVTCTGGNTLLLSGSMAAGADATFSRTCTYSGTSGQTVTATVNASFTDPNGVTGTVSGSPTTYTFTVQTL